MMKQLLGHDKASNDTRTSRTMSVAATYLGVPGIQFMPDPMSKAYSSGGVERLNKRSPPRFLSKGFTC
ncbi:MAG: hypothetical protein IKQ37_00345 [Bacteroidaceae bacterium]|nr:hypothetical protein [Bacteroidaceae bacterium]